MEPALEQFLEETVRPNKQPDVYLMVMNGPEDGRIFPVAKTPAVIGRLESNDVTLALDPTVSRVHAQVIEEQVTGGRGVYYIEDLNSSHGIEVNGARILNKMVLHNGSMILVGETLLCFRFAS